MAQAALRRLVMLILALSLTPVMRGSTSTADRRLVRFRLIAVDDKGNPVRGLTSSDFQVVDDGKKQNVAFVRYDGASVSEPETPGINEFSNRRRGEITHATVILFDLLNASFGTQTEVSTRLIQSLEKMERADYLYLYILTNDGRLFVVHGLPQTANASENTLAEPWTRSIKPLMNEAMRQVVGLRPTALDPEYIRIPITLDALALLGEDLSRVPGRKNLVWLTNGFPITIGRFGQFVDYAPLVRRVSDVLAQADISVYPARQILAPIAAGHEDTLNDFAAMTGGRLDHGRDISAVIEQAMKDVANNYLLGYYPAAGNWDDKFHNLSVTSTRNGVHIQTISGYYALPTNQAQQAFDMASAAKFDAAEIGLRASLSRKIHNVVHIDLHIDAHDIAFIPDRNDYIAQMQIIQIRYLRSGETQRGPIEPLTVHCTAEQQEEALEDGIDFGEDLTAVQSADRIRSVVFDRGSDAVGSITIPINVPAQRQN